jgi:hypothetical protein
MNNFMHEKSKVNKLRQYESIYLPMGFKCTGLDKKNLKKNQNLNV